MLQNRRIHYVVYNYGQIARYNTDDQPFYRWFCLPEAVGLPLLREWVSQEATRVYYPYAYRLWQEEYIGRLNRACDQAANVQQLQRLLKSGMLEEVFRYDENAGNPYEGIVVLKVPSL